VTSSVSPAQLRAGADLFNPAWVKKYPNLMRALASKWLLEIKRAKVAVAAATKVVAMNAALKELRDLAWSVHNDSRMSGFVTELVQRWLLLCYFHFKKAVKEHVESKGWLNRKDREWGQPGGLNEDMDKLFKASKGASFLNSLMGGRVTLAVVLTPPLAHPNLR
jgi:hypothetical protein